MMADLLMTQTNDDLILLSVHSSQGTLALIKLNAYSTFSFSIVHFQGENNAIHTQLALNYHRAMLESINLFFFFLPNKPAI